MTKGSSTSSQLLLFPLFQCRVRIFLKEKVKRASFRRQATGYSIGIAIFCVCISRASNPRGRGSISCRVLLKILVSMKLRVNRAHCEGVPCSFPQFVLVIGFSLRSCLCARDPAITSRTSLHSALVAILGLAVTPRITIQEAPAAASLITIAQVANRHNTRGLKGTMYVSVLQHNAPSQGERVCENLNLFSCVQGVLPHLMVQRCHRFVW